jgi:CMP-N,N'-diacetyllegionaminic acid synthase
MKPLVAVIPARGGSKRIPNKNISPLAGKPLLAYTIEAAQASGVVDRILVSTDSNAISQLAREFGAEVLMRPTELATDASSTESVLLHALDILMKEGVQPPAVLTLPPTSPLRSAETIRAFVAAFEQLPAEIDALISLTENRGDFWLKKEEGTEQWARLFPDAPRRRQDREPLYEENSALYLTRVAALRQTQSILGKRVAGYVIDSQEAVDINEPLDLLWAAFLLEKRSSR